MLHDTTLPPPHCSWVCVTIVQHEPHSHVLCCVLPLTMLTACSSGHGPPRSDTPGQMDAIAEVRDSIIAVNPPDLQTAPQHQLQQQA